jgi:hypothetical protein
LRAIGYSRRPGAGQRLKPGQRIGELSVRLVERTPGKQSDSSGGVGHQLPSYRVLAIGRFIVVVVLNVSETFNDIGLTVENLEEGESQMKAMLRILLLTYLTGGFFCQPGGSREPEATQTIEELEVGIQNKPPATYFALATELYRSGQKGEATFWYYVGQLRYRFFVLVKAKSSGSYDEQAHFWLLSESVGQSIYEQAGRRSAILTRAIDRALEWDLEQPNGYTSKTAFGPEYARSRQEMLALRQRIKTDPSSLTRRPGRGRGLISW